MKSSMKSSMKWRWTLAVGMLVALVSVVGVGVRATYGAQTTADEPQYLLTALSLVSDGDLDISDELAAGEYREFHEVPLPVQTRVLADGRQVSPHDPLLPMLLAVPVAVGGWVGAKVAMALMAGVTAGVVFWVATRRFGLNERWSALVTALFFCSPPLAVYATQVYPEMVAALAVAVAIGALTGPNRPGAVWVVGAAVVALPWLAAKYVPLAAVVAAAGLVWAGRWRLRMAGGLALAGVGYVWAHLAWYGGLTAYATGDHFVGGEFTAVGTGVDLWGRSVRLLGLLVDRGFGIGVWQPAFVVTGVAFAWLLSTRTNHARLLAGLAATGWLVATFVALTMHGWWFPGRQVVAVLPAFVLAVAVWGAESSRRSRTVVALALPGALAYGSLVYEGLSGDLTWVVDFAATANPVYGAVSSVLPDYMSPGPSTWLLHGVWLAVVVTSLWWGWRSGVRGQLPAKFQQANQRQPERLMT